VGRKGTAKVETGTMVEKEVMEAQELSEGIWKRE